jgi:catechol 2,3-dioxygenase-like lactoylglutathione lyase family enzyme
MSIRLFDHLDLRVANVARARALYDEFFPAVGFTKVGGSAHEEAEAWASYTAEGRDGGHPRQPFVWMNEEPNYRGSATRIAFWADTKEEVDRIGAVVRGAGAQVVEGPELCEDYSPVYYALFFEDLDGNKWEVCCRNAILK